MELPSVHSATTCPARLEGLPDRPFLQSARSVTPDRGVDTTANDIVSRPLLLQHEPHAGDVIPCMAPISLSVKIAQ